MRQMLITDWTAKAVASQNKMTTAMICAQDAISNGDDRQLVEDLKEAARVARDTADALTVAAAIAEAALT